MTIELTRPFNYDYIDDAPLVPTEEIDLDTPRHERKAFVDIYDKLLSEVTMPYMVGRVALEDGFALPTDTETYSGFVHTEPEPGIPYPAEGVGPQVDESDYDWQDLGLCKQVDTDMFFPEKGGSTREAKSVCLACEFKDQCLKAALDRDERFGIWGGLSERDRRALKKGAQTAGLA